MSKEVLSANGNLGTRMTSAIGRFRESLDYLRKRRLHIIVSSETAQIPVLYTDFLARCVVPKNCRRISIGGHMLSLIAVTKDGNISWVEPSEDVRTTDISHDEDFYSLRPRTIMVEDGRVFHNLAGLNDSMGKNRSALVAYFQKLVETYMTKNEV